MRFEAESDFPLSYVQGYRHEFRPEGNLLSLEAMITKGNDGQI
jgi:hypothetical protein